MAEHIQMTSPMLQAMTHPLRRRIMALMDPETPFRAVDLAARLGEPANSVSFHLRKLAEAGLIVEAPEHARDGRDRVWVGAGEGYGVPGPGVLDADEETLLRAVLDQAGVDLQQLVRRALGWAVEWSSGRDEVQRAEFTTGTLSLTREEMGALVEDLHAAIEKARQRAKHPAEGDEERLDWEFSVVVAEADLRREPPARP